MRQTERYTTMERMPGKTISAVEYCWHDSKFIISYTDRTYTVLEVKRGYEDDVFISIPDGDNNLRNHLEILQSHGVIDAEEYTATRNALDEKEQRRRIERDRRLYKRLKAYFEGGEIELP